jgi:phosphoglycerol transferase MdoB-like AlkP superfamily enzyme
MYAVDGQRFGDITTQLGFDRIISPPYGAAELIIGSMSDFPLSNLLMKAHIGKYLFPYSFANRTIAATYHPDDFIDLITSQLATRSSKPLFFSVHFGISHWPYRYADDNDHDSDTLSEKYRRSLRAADTQMKKFFDYLRNAKLLEHAIVVFVSDHGTGLGMPGDSLTDVKSYVGKKRGFSLLPRLPYSNNKREGIDTSYGYSTNILSLQQYHVLMAIKTFGVALGKPKQINERVSLMDIAPTLMDFLHFHPPKSADGISLLDIIKQNQAAIHVRKFFIENGFTSPEIAKAEITTATVLKDTINTVQLDSQTGLLYINDNAEKQLLKQKQRALLAGDWLLARQSPSVMILANIRSGEWTMDMDSEFAKRANIRQLMQDFRQYNESEI